MKRSYSDYYNQWENIKQEKEYLKKFDEVVGDVKNVVPTQRFLDIWTDINYSIQRSKLASKKLSNDECLECLQNISKRAYYLTKVCEYFNVKNVVEVGTAQGWQFYSFAEFLKDVSGKVWSCDIKDVRHVDYINKYENANFHLGDSLSLSSKLQDFKIDLFYIDGAHGKGDVLNDVLNLRRHQSDNPIWVFDDFDSRFGCYEDLSFLCDKFENHKVYQVNGGECGNSSHQVIIFGRL